MSKECVDIGLLISLVKSNPILYEKQSAGSSSNKIELKESSWVEIGSAMHLEVEQCQKLWKNLREAHCRELRQNKTNKGGSHKAGPFFHLLSFLNSHIKPRTRNAYIKFLNNSKVEGTLPSSLSRVIRQKNSSPILSSSSESNYIDRTNSPVDLKDDIFDIEVESTKCIEEIFIPEVFDKSVGPSEQFVPSIQNKSENADEAFAKFVSIRLQEMDKEKRKIKRLKIMQILEDD